MAALKEKMDNLEEIQETKELEHKEQMRIRDSKINILISKQRQIWKYLNKLERVVNKIPNGKKILRKLDFLSLGPIDF